MTAFYPTEGGSGLTMTIVNGATTVTFTGTDLTANVKVGDILTAAGGSSYITEVTAVDELAIFPPWPGEDGTDIEFRIVRGPEWSPTSLLNAQVNMLTQRLASGLLGYPNAWSDDPADRDQYDNQKKGFLFCHVPSEGSGDPAYDSVKLSDADADWSGWYTNKGTDGDDGASVATVLAELGITKITISTSDPSGGSNGELWLKVPA